MSGELTKAIANLVELCLSLSVVFGIDILYFAEL